MTLSPSASVREAGTSHPARRPARRRLSTSHILIGLVVILAFALNLLALRDRDATTLVAVADGPLSAGSLVTKDRIRFVPVDSDFEGLGSLVTESDSSQLEGWLVGRFIADGGLLERTMLVAPGTSDGQRSMSLPVPVEHAAGGNLTAGDRIDVISVVDGSAMYVARGLEVLAVSDASDRGLGAFQASHLVVAVSGDEGLLLAEAIDSGSIEVVKSTGLETAEESG